MPPNPTIKAHLDPFPQISVPRQLTAMTPPKLKSIAGLNKAASQPATASHSWLIPTLNTAELPDEYEGMKGELYHDRRWQRYGERRKELKRDQEYWSGRFYDLMHGGDNTSGSVVYALRRRKCQGFGRREQLGRQCCLVNVKCA